MEYQTSMLRGQPDDEAIKYLQFWEGYALQFDPRGYCVCTSEGKDSRVVGHLMRRAAVKHFYVNNVTGIDPPELVYFKRKNFQGYRDAGYLTYNARPVYTMWQLMRKKRMPPLRQFAVIAKESESNTITITAGRKGANGMLEQKKLDRLRKMCAHRVQEGHGRIALTINTILELVSDLEDARRERDALMGELKGICWACKNQKPWKMSVTGDTVACEHLAARGVVAAGGRAWKNCEHWQWRGPEGSE